MRKKTRELLFDEEPFTRIGGEEFALAELLPEVAEDELAEAPRHVSCLDYPLSEIAEEAMYKSNVSKKGSKQTFGKSTDLMYDPAFRADEIDVEDIPDPATMPSRRQTVTLVFLRRFKKLKRMISQKIAQSRRTEYPDGRVVLVLKHV